jgi:ABC-type sugar transport system permease subunit
MIFVTPVLMWLFLLIVLPHIDLLLMSFRTEDDAGAMVWSLINYLNFFDEPVYWSTFTRTAVYAILTTRNHLCRIPAGGLLHHQGGLAALQWISQPAAAHALLGQ